jgi:hypothetical protein
MDLIWFEEMSCSDWDVFKFADNLEYSPADTSTTHLNCHGDCAGDRYSSFRQMEASSAQEYLTQLDIALRPLKDDLVRSCITYTKHMEDLANFSVGIRSKLSETLSNQEVRRQLSGLVEKTIPSVIRVMGLAYLWLADSLDKDSVAKIHHSRSRYSPVTGRSLVCVLNSSCVVHTVTASNSRLSDSSRGCPILSKAHKKIDISMRFLARTLYFVVHGHEGEQWFD